MSLQWVPSSSNAGLPPNALFVGQDTDGSPLYVGRTIHNQDLLPVKIIGNKNVAYVPYNGEEVQVYEYEVLCGFGFNWVPCSGGQVPPNAVASGTTATGEPLFIGRGHWEGSLTPGKVHPSHGCLYLPHGGRERSLPNYEALVQGH